MAGSNAFATLLLLATFSTFMWKLFANPSAAWRPAPAESVKFLGGNFVRSSAIMYAGLLSLLFTYIALSLYSIVLLYDQDVNCDNVRSARRIGLQALALTILVAPLFESAAIAGLRHWFHIIKNKNLSSVVFVAATIVMSMILHSGVIERSGWSAKAFINFALTFGIMAVLYEFLEKKRGCLFAVLGITSVHAAYNTAVVSWPFIRNSALDAIYCS